MSNDFDSEARKRLAGTFHDQGMPTPDERADAAARAQRPRWMHFQHEGWDVATERAWAEACGAARVLLSTGERGHRVGRRESWKRAIERVAGELLMSQKLGRPMGRVLPSWDHIVRITMSLGSAADDGCVATESGLRVTIRSLPS